MAISERQSCSARVRREGLPSAAANVPFVVPPLGGSSPAFRLKPVLRTSAASFRARYSQAADSRVVLCYVEHGVFCDAAWAATCHILGVSPRQGQVARCLVAGQTDKQIAAALGLSWGTVQTHLRRLYKKLGIESRTELTTLVCAAYRAWRNESPPPPGCPQSSRL